MEYERRNESVFPQFKEEILFSGDAGANYRAKVSELPPEKAERFLYQEFVRHKHAERIRAWITGKPAEHLGVAHRAVEEINSLLQPLSPLFRRDLALVCESHHLTDLNDLQKYKVSQPYGNSPAQSANIQYVALLLRTADLLHMTGDRTPSIAFRFIDPADPVSQQEWAKQMAVTSVRSKPGIDKEGRPQDSLPRDTVEVHAYFTKVDGFFALTSFLTLVEGELKRTFDWALLGNEKGGSKYHFPWRYIDDRGIETEGFLRTTFSFNLDEARILDLLTGHTLYNDSSVVIRELAQNSIDAVRLQYLIDQSVHGSARPGSVRIHWSTKDRVLSVVDNGTGMTQRVIVEHLLKVGSSRYQDPDFTKLYPTVSAISRFGIGVLSTFMIADMVEIVTCHPEEQEARWLSLRSVHGKYLIRLVDKTADPFAREVAPHGTAFRLRLRPTAPDPDVVAIARRWIVIPGCDVRVQIDDQAPTLIGFASPADAVQDILKQAPLNIEDNGDVKVEQWAIGGTTIAAALRWSDAFSEWEFLQHPYAQRRSYEEREPPDFGTCVEGIRIDFGTPGFGEKSFIAVANAVGPGAPKTNVARSGLEVTPEREAALRAIYSAYCGHIKSQIIDLQQRGFSLDWAAREGAYLLGPILEPREGQPTMREALQKEVATVPILVVEEGEERRGMSPLELNSNETFWTTDSRLWRSAQVMMSEVSSAVSLGSLLKTLTGGGIKLPDGPALYGLTGSAHVERIAFSGKEVQAIHVYPQERRVDLKWGKVRGISSWISLMQDPRRVRLTHLQPITTRIMVARVEIEVQGISDESAVIAMGQTYVLSHTNLARYYVQIHSRFEDTPTEENRTCLDYLAFVILSILGFPGGPGRNAARAREEYLDFDAFAQGVYGPPEASKVAAILKKGLDRRELDRALTTTTFRVFNPNAWERKGG
jgi:hypothetical protein